MSGALRPEASAMARQMEFREFLDITRFSEFTEYYFCRHLPPSQQCPLLSRLIYHIADCECGTKIKKQYSSVSVK
jgi:hypothetical protein